MARSVAQDGIRRRGGALYGELRRLDLMHENGGLSDDAYRGARARLMRSVSDADLADATSAPKAAVTSAVGGGALLTLGAVALAAIAMIGATPWALIWISLAGLATVAVAACWEA
jgi:hypothetical protein